MTDQNPDRENLAKVLANHEPEIGHREAYCSCGAPIGNYGAQFDVHFADAILASDWLAEVKRQERETAWEECYEYMTRNRHRIARQVPDPNPYRRGEDA